MTKIAERQEKSPLNKSNLLRFLINIRSKVRSQQKFEDEELLEMIKEAHKQWKDSEKFFNNATDPDLIDYAIFEVEASRTKFRYLIKQAKQKGLRVEL